MDKVKQIASILRTKGVVSGLRRTEDEINQALSPCAIPPQSDNILYSMRRWNSYTPALCTKDDSSLGGGYFILWQGKGVVIDPGFDFIKNFQNAGFNISCIHAIVLTHSHLDHYANFEPLLTLFYEYNDQRKRDIKDGKTGEFTEEKFLHIYTSLGTIRKCSGWLDLAHGSKFSASPISRIYALDAHIGEAFIIPDTQIKIRPTYAEHNEVMATGYSIGVILELLGKDMIHKKASIAFTGDTAWTPEVHKQYDKCDLLVMHIGTVTEKELSTHEPYHKHLAAVGTIKLLNEKRDRCKLMIISEFGEEFRESRRNIITTLKQASPTPEKCVVADIGTKIKLPEIELLCEFTSCHKTAELRDIYDYYGVVRHYCREHTPYKSIWGVYG